MLFCLFLFITLASSFAVPHRKAFETLNDPWEEFQYAVDLDVAGKYWMFWTPDDETETITFEVHVEALGYVGFGISPNGGMTGADVVIGWVTDDGTPFFHDRYALGEYEPIIDDSQDVTLLAYSQNDTHTILRFSRPYVTCDEDDRDITDDTIRIIYSFTDTDPENTTGLQYHGSTNRGTKSVILLTYNDDGQTLPEDATSLEVLISENTVPSKRTTYWCEYIKIPQMEQEQHVVMFEPVIQPGNEGIVHHIVVYACVGELDDANEGVAWDCIENMMPNQHLCNHATFVWAVGGNAFYFPEHTGLPLFSPSDNAPVWMRMEMHYDNPSHAEGMTDHSGLRLYMTPTLREYEVGLLEVGVLVHPYMFIPPHFESLIYRGYGMPECFGQGLNTTDDIEENDQMNVFAVYQHSHLLGRKMKTRIYRDGTELEPLMNDDAYDFNFQETRKLKEERVVLPNDLLVLDCDYDSSEEQNVTTGGFATTDEMCVSFLYYYPRHPYIYALTLPPQYQAIQAVEGIETELIPAPPFFRITGPPEYVNMTTLEVFRTLDWTDEALRNRYQEVLLQENAPLRTMCVKQDSSIILPWWGYTPELGDDWIDPDDGQCDEIPEN